MSLDNESNPAARRRNGKAPRVHAERLSRRERVVTPRCTRFRDEVQERLAAATPDAGYHGAERRRWRGRVARLVCCLDELHTQGAGDSALGALLLLAFRAVLPLADPDWWRAHPRVRLNAEIRRQLKRIDKRRRRQARRRSAGTDLGRLGLLVTRAAAIYARHGDVAALGLCARLFDSLDQALAGTGAVGPPVIGQQCRTSRPAAQQRRSPTATTPGPLTSVPGKEEDAWTSTAFCSGST